ncbi:Non-specific serine/threonine protein kinase [Bertholletia excelsa]
MTLLVEIVMAGFLLQCSLNRWWVAALLVVHASTMVVSDPQSNLLILGCSTTRVSDMFSKLNATLADLRSQISDQKKSFATAQQVKSSGPVFAMAQCRDYLSTADCVACFDAAVKGLRNCSGFDGGRVIYDGCFLRYESGRFYDEGIDLGHGRRCGGNTVAQSMAFRMTVQGLLTDLAVATPRIKGFFAAAKKEVIVGANETVYSIAQCVKTVTKSACRDCLNIAKRDIMSCPPQTDGRAYVAGCFLRFSKKAFFAANYTIDISPFLHEGVSSKKKAIIIGTTIGGGGSILLIVFIAFLWYRRSRKSKADPRANQSGGSELQGTMLYSYKDLKSATKNFSEVYKLGEGGFGDVYKGILTNGNIVAVKRMALASSRVKSDFEIEVKLISNVHHRNLLRLLGCSHRGPELLLVYDYMANGSLDSSCMVRDGER